MVPGVLRAVQPTGCNERSPPNFRAIPLAGDLVRSVAVPCPIYSYP